MASVLLAEGWASEPIDGEGDFRARVEGIEIAYSGEEVGWQVVVDGDLPRAEDWMAQVTEQVAVAAGEACEWLEF